MANSSANSSRIRGAIVDLSIRRQLKQSVDDLFALLEYPEYQGHTINRILAEAEVLFGDDLVYEIVRIACREGDIGLYHAITLCRMISSETAREVLLEFADDPFCSSQIRLEALRTLKKMGEPIDMCRLVALTNECQYHSSYSHPYPQSYQHDLP
jgi:hypothetical protein